MSVANNLLVAGTVVCPIDKTASTPPISFGGSAENNSGTGIYGTFGSVKTSISGTLSMNVDSNGLTLTNDVAILNGAGVPTNGTTGATVAGPGSLYIDITNSNAYINANTKVSPTWKLITRAA